MKRGKIALFGHGSPAAAVLDALNDDRDAHVAMVNTSETEIGPLRATSSRLGLPTFSIHPRKREEQLRAELYDHVGEGGILVSVNYRYLLPGSLLDRFDHALNIHGSLLPQYRGRTPHVWATINGETETGISVHRIDEGVDTGPIVCQEVVPIENWMTGADLLSEFQARYPRLVLIALHKVLAGEPGTTQDEARASYFGKRTPDMGLIDFRTPFEHLKNFVRALAPPYPGAYCFLPNGNKVVVEAVRIVNTTLPGDAPRYAPQRVGGRILVRTDYGVVECLPASEEGSK